MGQRAGLRQTNHSFRLRSRSAQPGAPVLGLDQHHGSAFTRNEARSALIAAAQAQQQGVRKIVAGGGGAGSLQDQAAGYRQDIKRLEAQLTHMVAAHAGLIRAVQMAGGGPALERFWRDYKAVGDAVHSLSAANAERPVTHLPLRVVKMSDGTAD